MLCALYAFFRQFALFANENHKCTQVPSILQGLRLGEGQVPIFRLPRGAGLQEGLTLLWRTSCENANPELSIVHQLLRIYAANDIRNETGDIA